MAPVTEEGLTEAVTASLGGEGRGAEVLRALVRHAHAFVEETGLTHEEWLDGMAYLKEVAGWCDDRRDEMILLSDNLGVSAMVDLVSDRGRDGRATERTGLGPFHLGGQPFFETGASLLRAPAPGAPLWFEVAVEGPDGAPVEGAVVDAWQAHADGLYDLQEGSGDNLRGRFRTGPDGRTSFVSVMPQGYPLPPDGPCHRLFAPMKAHYGRPAHVHLIVSAPGHRALVTHLFDAADPDLARDAVYGVRPSLVLDFTRREALVGGEPDGLKAPYHHAEARIVLRAEADAKERAA